MNKQKKIIFYIAVFLLAVAAVFGFIKLYQTGQDFTVRYISEKIQSEMKKQGKNRQLKWETLSVSFIPLKVKMTKVTVNMDNDLLPAPLRIHTIVLEPDYIALLNKKLSAKITLIKSSALIKVTNKIRKKSRIKTRLSMEVLQTIPISNLVLKDMNLAAVMNTNTLSVQQLNTNIRVGYDKVTIKANAPFVKIGSQAVFSSEINIAIKPSAIDITYFKVKNKNSWLDITSIATGEIESRTLQSGKMTVNGSFLSEDITAIANLINPDFTNPFQGRVTLKSNLQYDKSSQLEGHVDLLAEQFSAWNVFLSQVQIKADIKNQIMSFKKFQIDNADKWHIRLGKSKLHLKKPYSFKTKAIIRNSQMRSLFEAFNLKTVPLASRINGEWNCKGAILANQMFQCKGLTHLKQFTVMGGKEWNVLEIPSLKVNSRFGMENKIFKAVTTAQPGPDSLINMESVFEKGVFSSRYKGVVQLADIQDLIQLEPKGKLNIVDGTMKIKKDTINIQANLEMDQLVLSQFLLGNVKTQVSYTEKGLLRFRKIRGQVNKSLYKGNCSINIFKNNIQVFAHFPYVTLENLKYALKDRIYFPFEISGTGTVSAYLNGPLKINALNYTLEAQLFKLKWEGESFKKAVIKIESKKGYVKTKKVELLKKTGKILFQGEVNPKGNMAAKMVGMDLRLQDSENISRITGPETTGIMNFNMSLNGFFLKPISKVNILIKKSFYRGYPFKNSKIDLNIRKKQIEARGSIADKLIIQKFIFPYKKDGVVELQAKTNNWNIKEFFISKGESTQLYNQFQSNIDSTINLSYQKDQFLSSATGEIKVNNLSVHANSYKLKNQFPFLLKIEKGQIQTNPVLLQSGAQFLNIVQNKDKNIDIKGNIKMDFFIFLFPFMRVWEGDIAVNVKMNPQLFNLSPVGKMQLKNGFVHLNPNIDPFEDIYSDIKVEKFKMIFQSLYAKIGGGSLQAVGDIHFQGNGSVPVNVTGSFSHVQFSSLPGVYARGSGQIFLTGNNFPYTLGIKANIKESRIEKEFISNQPAQVKINPRLFLLEENKKSFEPIKMNFNFYLTDPIQLENSTMQSLFTAQQIKVTGTPLHPLISGKLTALPGGAIIFRDHEFEILSSDVSYSSDKVSNPNINLQAKTFIQEETDKREFPQEYSILLRVKGRASAPVFTLTSTPPLTENDIVSILAFGSRAITFEPGNAMDNIAKYSYYQLGPTLFQKAIGRELKDTLGVDQFLIVPHISSKDNTTKTKIIVRKKNV